MANKKGYCIKCNKNDEVRRIFDVNSDTRYCHCPHCGKRYRPKVAIHNYQRVISHYLKRANFYLRNVGEVKNAYFLFAYVMDLEPENKSAKLGRLLSLAYLSTLRRNRFIEVEEMLRIEKEAFHGVTFKKQYSDFLISLNFCIDTYMEGVKKALTLKTYYFDVDCIKLLFKHNKDALSLKRLINDELSICEEEKLSSQVAKTFKKYEGLYNQTLITADGFEHHFASFTNKGEPLLTSGNVKRGDVDLSRYRLSTLDSTNKKLKHISDKVYTVKYLRMYHFYLAALPLAVIVSSFFLTTLVLFFIFQSNPALMALFMSLTILFAAIAVSLVLSYFVLKTLLKKQRLK